MIANGKALFKFVDSILEPLGYQRKKDVWYFSTTDCICHFWLRKSEFGGYYESALGSILREIYLEKDEYPPPHKRHLLYPTHNFIADEKLRRLFDLENQEFSKNEREDLITDFLTNYAIPFLTDVSTKDGIKSAMINTKI